jgi:hypothetical protein
MKTLKLFVSVALAAMFCCCGNNYSDFLRKYGTEARTVEKAQNRAGISVSKVMSSGIAIRYRHVGINYSEANMNLIAKRFFVADARTPNSKIEVDISNKTVSTTEYSTVDSVKKNEQYNATVVYLPEKYKSGFFILGFTGIDSTESAAFATPPLFFVIGFDDKGELAVVDSPSLADGFFATEAQYEQFVNNTMPMRTGLSVYDVGVLETGAEDNGQVNVLFFYGINPALDDGWGKPLVPIGKFALPFETEIACGDKTAKATRFWYSDRAFKFAYKTTDEPDRIIVSMDDGTKTVFDAKTKAVIVN